MRCLARNRSLTFWRFNPIGNDERAYPLSTTKAGTPRYGVTAPVQRAVHWANGTTAARSIAPRHPIHPMSGRGHRSAMSLATPGGTFQGVVPKSRSADRRVRGCRIHRQLTAIPAASLRADMAVRASVAFGQHALHMCPFGLSKMPLLCSSFVCYWRCFLKSGTRRTKCGRFLRHGAFD